MTVGTGVSAKGVLGSENVGSVGEKKEKKGKSQASQLNRAQMMDDIIIYFKTETILRPNIAHIQVLKQAQMIRAMTKPQVSKTSIPEVNNHAEDEATGN